MFIHRCVNHCFETYFTAAPELCEALQTLADATIAITCRPPDFTAYLHLSGQGLRWVSSPTTPIQCMLEGSPSQFLGLAYALSQQQPPNAAFQGMRIQGDLMFLSEVQRLFRQFPVDAEELLASAVGDYLAHPLYTAAKTAQNWLDRTLRFSLETVVEYLQEEKKVLPTETEVDRLYSDSTRLRDDVDRMEARIRQLALRANKSSPS